MLSFYYSAGEIWGLELLNIELLNYTYLLYLLRLVLKATAGLGRNNASCRSVLMVSTSSRAKSNNIVAGNKLNFDYFSFYSLA